MRNYNYKNKWEKLLTPEVVSLLTQIHEYKGEQTLFIEAKADTLTQLVEIAKIQSTEASNKIEGIYTSDERLKSLVSNKTTPRTRNEQEIAGYRDVLSTIHESHDFIPVKPSIILQLHRDLYKFSGKNIGGSYKGADNVIAEEDNEGNKHVRFNPVPAWETPAAIDAICEAFDEILAQTDADPLLIIPMFILDFLCIHPFNDGNGRMSRLLTLLLLYRAGYIVGKYISIEKLIEQTKDTYYDVLQACQNGWDTGTDDPTLFIRYLLQTILSAYRDFEERVDMVGEKTSALETVRRAAESRIGRFTKREIMELCPTLSKASVESAIKQLVDAGQLVKQGSGRSTFYTRSDAQ